MIQKKKNKCSRLCLSVVSFAEQKEDFADYLFGATTTSTKKKKKNLQIHIKIWQFLGGHDRATRKQWIADCQQHLIFFFMK